MDKTGGSPRVQGTGASARSRGPAVCDGVPPDSRTRGQSNRRRPDPRRMATDPPSPRKRRRGWERHHKDPNALWSPNCSPSPRQCAPPAQRLSLCAVWCSSTKVPPSRCNAAEMCFVTFVVVYLTGAPSQHSSASVDRPRRNHRVLDAPASRSSYRRSRQASAALSPSRRTIESHSRCSACPAALMMAPQVQARLDGEAEPSGVHGSIEHSLSSGHDLRGRPRQPVGEAVDLGGSPSAGTTRLMSPIRSASRRR